MKIWISIDMEGISGLLAEDDLMRGRYDYDLGRRRMTADLNAAVRGAFAGGAEQVVVTDSHGAMRNVVIEDLDPRVELIQGTNTPLVMAQGLEEVPDLAFLIGYHSRAGSVGVLSHTWSSSDVWDVRVNGTSVGEIGLVATAAGHHGVPVALISGDDVACEEAAQLIPGIAQVVTKQTINRSGARLRHPQVVADELARTAQRVIEDRSRPAPVTFDAPAHVELEWLSRTVAGVATLVPGVTAAGDRTTRFTAEDSLGVLRMFVLLTTLAIGVEEE